MPSLHQTLLSVPALSRNFLISPPGSPPVGWEQTLEEAPNPNPLPSDVETGGDGGWAEELSRALRFLSTTSGGDEEEEGVNLGGEGRPEQNGHEDDEPSTTQLLMPTSSSQRPAITVSTPSAADVKRVNNGDTGSGTGTPPPGAQKISSVKATIESMLGRKRSYSDLSQHQQSQQVSQQSVTSKGASAPSSSSSSTQAPVIEIPGFGTALGTGPGLGGGPGGKSSITPTARPPIAPEGELGQRF